MTALSSGQDVSEKRISELIDKLSWESVTIDCNYILVLTQSDSISNELVEIGEPTKEKLLKALKNPEKSVAIHVILTRIFDDKKRKINGIGTKYIYKNCKESIGWHHVYNGITWEWTSEKGQDITQEQIDLAYNYWDKKLILKEKVKMPNSERIFERLTKEDNIKYPCIDNKNYENNSENIKFTDLKKVIGLRVDNKNLEMLMQRLGNDTINSYHNDSYFIENSPDGIEFKFASNDSLIRIFLTKDYKGTLWNNISFKYKKRKIERKLPKPDERKSGGGKQERFWYREPNLEIFFNSDETIKYIMIGL
ncbi:hypothetical protein ATO12_03605 [Aquimarina atlantica]|uniref:Uncharacterized protein n=2 Tax=Aquimarina atlantica TaxID=1317122 RepID=A0A023C0Z9_9FLAO|nr:hypothetical protein ATO12_03605 [Aquimarina atlantica]